MTLITISATDELHTKAIEAMQAGDMMFIDWSTPFFIDKRAVDHYDIYLAFGVQEPLTDLGAFLEELPIAEAENAEQVHEVIGGYLLK